MSTLGGAAGGAAGWLGATGGCGWLLEGGCVGELSAEAAGWASESSTAAGDSGCCAGLGLAELNRISPQEKPTESSDWSSRLVAAISVDPKRLKTIVSSARGETGFEDQTFTNTLRRVNRNWQAGPPRVVHRDVSDGLDRF